MPGRTPRQRGCSGTHFRRGNSWFSFLELVLKEPVEVLASSFSVLLSTQVDPRPVHCSEIPNSEFLIPNSWRESP